METIQVHLHNKTKCKVEWSIDFLYSEFENINIDLNYVTICKTLYDAYDNFPSTKVNIIIEKY